MILYLENEQEDFWFQFFFRLRYFVEVFFQTIYQGCMIVYYKRKFLQIICLILEYTTTSVAVSYPLEHPTPYASASRHDALGIVSSETKLNQRRAKWGVQEGKIL
jgi:hypothetical protein